MKANQNVVLAANDNANLSLHTLIGAVIVVVVFAVVVTLVAGNLATAAANASVISLGVGGFMTIIAIVFIAVVIYGLVSGFGHHD